MPKEYVRAGWEPCDFCVVVGWSRKDSGGHVQLATIRDRDNPESGDDPANGLYMTMDRESINAVIRVLRRARDQAFGRDE